MLACACRDVLKLPAGASAVVTNGRVVLAEGNLAETGQQLTAADFKLMDLYARNHQFAAEVGCTVCVHSCMLLPALTSCTLFVQASSERNRLLDACSTVLHFNLQ